MTSLYQVTIRDKVVETETPKKKRVTRIFALTFSYAHVYLDDAKTEADFGLKVAVNAVSDEKLRSVERANIGAAIRDFAQAAGQRDLRSFGIDDALDLIRKVSGRAEDSDFAQNVTGSRALRFSKKIELTDVPDAAIEAVQYFKSKAYQGTGFRFIDFLSPVLDTAVEEKLNDELISALQGTSDEFEVALPEIVSESIVSFRFEHAGFSDFHPDLSLELYRGSLGSKLASLTLEDIERHSIAAYSESENRPLQSWSVHRALVGSLVLKDERYALNEGRWYQIGKNFKEGADRKFSELHGPPDKKLRPLKKSGSQRAQGQEAEDRVSIRRVVQS
ncbi:TIGR04141 family sporadically distributed protein [Bradyrhizobium sp. 1.29L]